MGMDSLQLPPIPDLSIIDEVIGLADASEAERSAQRPAGYPMYEVDDLVHFLQPRPRWRALVDYLRRLPEETVAGLYAMYRLGDLPRSDARAAAARFRDSYEIAIQPMHSKYGAGDLAAKGPLVDGLRRGLENLGLELEPGPGYKTDNNLPKTAEGTPR